MKLVKVITVILGVLMIIGGLYCLFNPARTYLGIGTFIGLGIIVAGCETLTIALTPREAY